MLPRSDWSKTATTHDKAARSGGGAALSVWGAGQEAGGISTVSIM
jgi:hypothetical protein